MEMEMEMEIREAIENNIFLPYRNLEYLDSGPWNHQTDEVGTREKQNIQFLDTKDNLINDLIKWN